MTTIEMEIYLTLYSKFPTVNMNNLKNACIVSMAKIAMIYQPRQKSHHFAVLCSVNNHRSNPECTPGIKSPGDVNARDCTFFFWVSVSRWFNDVKAMDYHSPQRPLFDTYHSIHVQRRILLPV